MNFTTDRYLIGIYCEDEGYNAVVTDRTTGNTASAVNEKISDAIRMAREQLNNGRTT